MKKRRKLQKMRIKKRLNEYGVGGLLKHLYKKSIDGVWSGADQNSMIFFYAEPLHEGLASDLFYWKGKYSNTVLLLMKCVYLFYLSLGVLGTGMSWRRGDKNIISLFRLNLLGIFRFCSYGRLLKDTYFCLCRLFFSLQQKNWRIYMSI